LTGRSTSAIVSRVNDATGARARLVGAAARLFLTRSYHAVGVDELCTAAGVRKGSFYHFFPTKADLAKAVVDHHADALWARLRPAGTVASAAERLRLVADAIGDTQAGFEERFGKVVGCPFGNLAAELAAADEPLRLHLQAVFAHWQHRLTELCRQAADEGTLRAGTDPALLARILLAQYQGLILLAKTDHASAAQIAPALHEILDRYLPERVRP
jgi:TetR/AcrR family transcriptional repressor of nem operon